MEDPKGYFATVCKCGLHCNFINLWQTSIEKVPTNYHRLVYFPAENLEGRDPNSHWIKEQILDATKNFEVYRSIYGHPKKPRQIKYK